MIVFSSLFYEDKYLIVGTSKGTLNIFNIIEEAKKKTNQNTSINVHKGSIYSLASKGNILVSGSSDNINIYDISKLISFDETTSSDIMNSTTTTLYSSNNKKQTSLFSTIHPPSYTNAVTFNHSNDMNSSILFSGNGDGNAYSWDINTQQCIGTFTGHSDYIHDICCPRENLLATASEDGLARAFDTRSHSCIALLDPITGSCNTNTNNNTYNKRNDYVPCLASDSSGDWLAIGSSYRMIGLWHLPSLLLSMSLPTAGIPQAISFIDDKILTVGTQPSIYHWEKNGKLDAIIDSLSLTSIFSITSLSSKQIHVITGNSSKIDIFIHSKIYSFSLECV